MSRGNRFTREFRDEAVRLALTSGRSRHEIAQDLGVGRSTLTRWISSHIEEDHPATAPRDLEAELRRLRRENEILRQERDILKKAAAFFARETSR